MKKKNRSKAVICEDISTGRCEVFHSFTEAGIRYGVSNQLISRACNKHGRVLNRYVVRVSPRYYVIKTGIKQFRVCTYNHILNRYEEVTGQEHYSENSVLGVKDVTAPMCNDEEVMVRWDD